MYLVLLYRADGTVSEYRCRSLQYAKRYADLYKAEYPYIEIHRLSEEGDFLLESLGRK